VEFFKRDELTTDLICCEVMDGSVVHFAHEEASDWQALISSLSSLPGFDVDRFAKVTQPTFAESRYLAFSSKA